MQSWSHNTCGNAVPIAYVFSKEAANGNIEPKNTGHRRPVT